MPKSRKAKKINGITKTFTTPTKLRIGPRKSGVNAAALSSEKLRAVLADSNKKRYHNKAKAVLMRRGCEVTVPVTK